MNTPQTREEGDAIAQMIPEKSVTIVPMKNGLYTAYGMLGAPVFPGTLDEILTYARGALEGAK